MSGAKDDSHKLRLSLVPASLDIAVAEVREYGVAKYGDRESWRTIEQQRYFEALLRHVQAMRSGGLDAIDPESGLTHIKHVACNAAFLIEMGKDANGK